MKNINKTKMTLILGIRSGKFNMWNGLVLVWFLLTKTVNFGSNNIKIKARVNLERAINKIFGSILCKNSRFTIKLKMVDIQWPNIGLANDKRGRIMIKIITVTTIENRVLSEIFSLYSLAFNLTGDVIFRADLIKYKGESSSLNKLWVATPRHMIDNR